MTDNTDAVMRQISSLREQVEALETKVKRGDGNLKANIEQLDEQVRRLWHVVFEGDEDFNAQPLTIQIAAVHKSIERIDDRWNNLMEKLNGVKITVRILVGAGVLQGFGIGGVLALVAKLVE